MARVLDRIVDLCTLPGRIIGWLILPLILFVCLTVFAAKAGMNTFIRWDSLIPVFGRGITVNTLLDLQWYIFALMALFGGTYAFRDEQHVSVDFVSTGFSEEARMVIRILGDLVLLLPFCTIIAWYGLGFTMTSYASGEGSTYGGLLSRWLIKAAVPLGFALLGIAALARAASTLLKLVERRGGNGGMRAS
jgi:TRAP-type mannitol/chloroaromatic compound transport system permease small subunit